MSRQRARHVVRYLISLFLILMTWCFFSTWEIVVQPRSKAGDPVTKSEALEVASAQPDEKSSPKKDVIQKDYGHLERVYLEAANGTLNSPPKRSRDESIRFLYNVKDESDWMDLVEGHDSHGLLALTKTTQKYLYNKQNPDKCEGQRYLILNHFQDDMYGVGALFQHIADYLSIAIQTNSILIYAQDQPPGQNFVQAPGDGGDKACGRSLDCIFQPVSKCKHDKQKGVDEKLQSIFASSDDGNFDLNVPEYLNKNMWPVPPIFEDALRMVQPDITTEMLKYWWRAQAAGYLMRLNGSAASRMKEMRLGNGVKQLGMRWDENSEPHDVTMPFPMPEGTISMHVRHGDKGSEMRLVPFNKYVIEAEKLGATNPLGYWKRGFLSTEDPNVVEQMKSMARVSSFEMSGSNSRWTWYWSDIPRLNSGPEPQLAEFGDRTELTIKWLLQLVMAIECDAFIGTRGSGWNRLIDSLRCIWLASCKQPYVEVGHENDWTGYGP